MDKHVNNTENYGLLLFEGDDPVSRKAFNENTEAIDLALHAHDDELAVRTKMAGGSWVGQTACTDRDTYQVYSSAYGSFKNVEGSLGTPNSSSRDITIELDFEPRRVEINGYMEASVNWSGYLAKSTLGVDGNYYTTYEAFTLTGKEFISCRQTVHHGSPLCFAEVAARYPAITKDYYGGQAADWSVSAIEGYYSSGSFGTSASGAAPVPCFIPALVEFGTTEDGKYTVTIKGANADYGTENYADIEGMTYNWVAFG